jgi:hypothetical protein
MICLIGERENKIQKKKPTKRELEVVSIDGRE